MPHSQKPLSCHNGCPDGANAAFESFNGGYRHGMLDMHIFRTPNELSEQTEHWLPD